MFENLQFFLRLHLKFAKIAFMTQQIFFLKNINMGIVRHRPEQNRVTWETTSSEAFVPLQELVGVLASYGPHAKMQVWSETSVVVHNLYFARVTIMG